MLDGTAFPDFAKVRAIHESCGIAMMAEDHIALTGVGPKVEGLRWESNHVLRIGRANHVEVVVHDTSLERVHAELKFHGQRWMLRDMAENAFYPTVLNGRAVTEKPIQVRLNDLLMIGSLAFRVSELGKAAKAEVVEPPAVPKSALDKPIPPLPSRESYSSEEASLEEPAKPGFLVVTGVHRLPQIPGDRPQSVADLQVLQVQASTRRSWDESLEQATASLNRRPDSNRTMLTLLRANHHLSNLSNLDDLLQHILADAIGALEAQRGAILLFDPRTEQLELKAMKANKPTMVMKKAYSRTLADRCYRQGESLLCRDMQSEQDVGACRSALFGSMSSIVCALLRTSRRRVGVLHLDRGPMQEPFTESDLYLADAVAANIAVGIECAQLVEAQRDQFLETVTTLARAVEARDQYTGDHTRRVTDFALLLADELKVSATDRYTIQIGTPLHDIGKIGIDDAVLRKPGKLTEGEFEHMKSHTVKGAAMLDGFFNLAPLVPIVRSHHERWDGTGYPDHLTNDKIAQVARIVAIADTFDAMTSNRPYRPALPPQLAFMELLSKAGTHFDPKAVQAFVRLRPKVEDLMRTQKSGE